ncbi:hypothetical protein J7S20_02615 [Sphingomonadaceae bacterium LXI357]|uniref:Uncharacterized protein n=2 Tax=Stakelama marina TaxID=2826939 RepID=A0A8T4IEH2_9SPHN|nr:hypothetical protein [Stakelama marina]
MQDGETSQPPQRVRSVVLYGDEKCPKAEGDEIVVCAHAGESPYRIPKEFRRSPPDVAHQAWTRRAEMVEDVNRAGLPDSCSPIGTGGQTGCTAEMIRRAAEAKKEQQRQSNVPK